MPPLTHPGPCALQMHRFAQWSAISFLFSGYQWVFNNPACNGFIRFPTFGLQALSYTWNFDFQLPFVGLGILAPVSVAWSLVVGGECGEATAVTECFSWPDQTLACCQTLL